jgi:DNA polymerase (family 10)
MKNHEIARLFNDIADILEVKDENPFRIRAYRRAAQNIEGLAEDIALMKKEELTKIPGIGKDLADKIREYIETGRIGFYEDLMAEFPPNFVEILSVPGLGPKMAKLLYEKLNVSGLDTLEELAKRGKLRELPGIREKTEENILKGIAMIKRRIERHPIGHVLPIAEEIIQQLRDRAPVQELSLAGSLRRWKETVKDIDILAASKLPEKVMNVFVHLPQIKEVLMKGNTKTSIITKDGIHVDLRVVALDSFGSALAYFTGSKAHNIRLREMAVKRGLRINEYGVFEIKKGKKIGGRKEEDIYKALGLVFIPPELREDAGEIEAAANSSLPDLIELKDIKGDLHVHTDFSDGNQGIEHMAKAAKKRGYSYIAITDHSKSLGVAKGMSIETLMEQIRIIRSINEKMKGFRLLTGIEVDIKADGSMDYPDDVLKELDVVVASIHSGFRQSADRITRRLISAMKNPYVSIIAHPTGRLIGEREAYEIDIESVLKMARDTRTAIEINAYPLRLDLIDTYAKKAGEMGIALAISTDAHRDDQFGFMKYGVGIARRAWLEKKAILNTYTSEALFRRLRQKRKG